MQNDAATLQCPNDLCKAPNSQTDKFCQRCGTPLIKRYLWAVGEKILEYKLGDLVADRYLLKSDRIFLDTKPGLSAGTPYSEISNAIKPYLRLVSYRLQIPQVYGWVPLGKGRTEGEILLLEQAPIYTEAVPVEGQLMPELTSVWKDATSIRQLNWLWQMATLWQPLSSEGVASSLLNPQLLRVEGSLIRLLELQPNQGSAPALPELGQMWSQLAALARPSIASFLKQLCFSLKQGEVQSAEQLIAILDRGLAEVERSLAPSTLRIATRTDKGPSRQRNEDACYPPSGTTITKPPEEAEALAIVCDGIGGHEGGNVASNLAIETIQQQVQQMPLEDACLDTTTISSELEDAARVANDRISQRNDNEHRHGRQRMGTTLVMALACAHEIYITHVGDSRAYWITRTGCHQVTLDDDVASREVRLGYSLYRDALQQASAGSLVQALGMSSSASLHPTVQRFVLDEDCVFLLCSDGLSDYDRVEQCWETEILPILDGNVDVACAAARLVEIANTENGHDNVTVGLIYCQVSSEEPESILSPSLAQQITVPPDSAYLGYEVGKMADTNDSQVNSASPSKLQTQLLPSQPAPRRSFVPLLLGMVLVLGLGSGLLLYLWKQGFLPFVTDPGSSPSVAPAPIAISPRVEPPIPRETANVLPKHRSLIRIKSAPSTNNAQSQKAPLLLEQRSEQPNNQSVIGFIPDGALVQVKDPKEGSPKEKDDWLWLEVCHPRGEKANSELVGKFPTVSNTTPAPPKYPPVKSGQKGWIRFSEIEHFYERAGLGECPASTTPAEAATPVPDAPPPKP